MKLLCYKIQYIYNYTNKNIMQIYLLKIQNLISFIKYIY